MSGYLHRLVSSAIKPTTGVHPVIAPLFSIQHGTPGEDLADPAVPGFAPRMSADFAGDREPPVARANVDAISPHSLSVEAAATRSPAEDVSPRDAKQSAVQVHGDQLQKHATSGERPAALAATASTQPVYIPLLPERSNTVSGPAVDPHPPAPLTGTSRGGRDVVDRIRSSGSNQRVPDEIQITIGRIEVTAVPEVPPRAAAKPRLKQLSLDEYLRRADGRGR